MTTVNVTGFSNIEAILRQIAGNVALIAQALPVPLTSSTTWDPANLASGSSLTKTITVTGAVLGNIAQCSFSLDLQGMTLVAYVSAADTVTCVLSNLTGGAINLASGTLAARVWTH